MSLLIFYTPRSKETLVLVYDFINNKFGTRDADKFASKAEKTIELIAEWPFMFKAATFDNHIRLQ